LVFFSVNLRWVILYYFLFSSAPPSFFLCNHMWTSKAAFQYSILSHIFSFPFLSSSLTYTSLPSTIRTTL
jgi:hypothetical protein